MAATTMATMSLLAAKCSSISPKTTVKLATSSPPKISVQTTTNSLIQKLPAMAVLAALGACEPAVAVQQIADVAAAAAENDNRGLALLLPVAPAIAWVLYNILQPALNQLNKMRESKGAIAAAGLGGIAGLGLIYSPEAEAAAEAAAAAGGDNRGTLLLVVIAPAIGWVLYNILQPALNQLNKMSFLSLYALSLTLVSSSPRRHESGFVSLNSLLSSFSSSSSRTRCSASTMEEEEGDPVQVQPTSMADESVKFSESYCEACGRGEVEKGCNRKGRIQGGIATIPGFGWWPIKAYRPCPGFLAVGGRYKRQGQSMDEVVSGRGN